MLVADAPAKVNLFLGVGQPRSDGYHSVATVLHSIELCDRVTLLPAERLRVRCDADLGVPAEQNLVHRAAVAMGEAFGRESAVSLSVDKRIPHGAGLGGGSSDAAATVALLATLWDVDPLAPACLEVAASLGADVPFFLSSTGAALMTGRGDVFERELPALAAPVVLAMPPERVPTQAAYRAFDSAPQAPGDPAEVVAALEAADAGLLAGSLRNNMEHTACSIAPSVCDALALIRREPGVRAALVAGSGSAVFGMCDSERTAAKVADAARREGYWACVTRLRQAGVRVHAGSTEGRT